MKIKFTFKLKKIQELSTQLDRLENSFAAQVTFASPLFLPHCKKFMSNAYARKFHKVLNTVDTELFFQLFEMVLSADQQQFC